MDESINSSAYQASQAACGMRQQYKEGLPTIALAVTAGGFAAWLTLPAWACLFVTGLCAALLPIGILLHDRQKRRVKHQQAQAFIQRLIDVVPQPIYVKDAESRYVVVNQALAVERGCSVEDMIGRSSINPLLSPDHAQRIRDEDAAVLRGERVFKEECIPHPQTGEPHYEMVMKACCSDTNKRPLIIGANFDITAWRIAELTKQASFQRLQKQREGSWRFLESVLDCIPQHIYVKDAQSRYLILNKYLAAHKGLPREELMGSTGMSYDSAPETMRKHYEEDGSVLAGNEVHKEQHRFHRRTGLDDYTIIDKRLSTDTEGNQVIVGLHFDVTGLRVAELNLKNALDREKELRQRTQDFIQNLIDAIPDPVYIKNASSEFLIANKAFLAERKVVIGKRSWEDAPNPDTAITIKEDAEVIAGAKIEKELRFKHPVTGAETFRVVSKHRCISIDGSPVIFVLYFNITRLKQVEQALQRLVQEDSLTGIANRRYFHTEVERCFSRADRHIEPASLCLLDLDHFKLVNDQHGHLAGDEVLVEMVRRTKTCLRSYDIFARWGGEEFIVLLPLTTGSDAMIVAERIRRAISDTPFETSGGQLHIQISGGVAERTTRESIEQLTARADEALYRAKQGGRNRVASAAETPEEQASRTNPRLIA